MAAAGVAAPLMTASPASAGGQSGRAVHIDGNWYPKRRIRNAVNMADKVVVITGASRGIGLAAGEYLQAAGATVIGTSRTPGAHPSHPFPLLELDLEDEVSVATFIGTISTHPDVVANGGIDALVNNAGRFVFGSPIVADPGTWFGGVTDGLAVLYGGHLAVANGLFPLVAARAATGFSHMSFTCSLVGYAVGGSDPGISYYHNYISGKRALLAYANNLRALVDAAGLGINISTINPMAIRTGLAAGTNPIFLQPVDGNGDAIGDPVFQEFLDGVRAFIDAGIPVDVAGEAVGQLLQSPNPDANIAIGGPRGILARQGGNDFAFPLAIADNAEAAYRWAPGRG